MYKSFKINKKYEIAFNKFPKTAKVIRLPSRAYDNGIRIWDSQSHMTYALVIGVFRIMLYVNNLNFGDCNGG